jgi:two-component system, NarL family, invasion response regulator UvrY
MIKIFVADDHALVREGLKKILKDEFDLKVVGEAQNATEVLDKLHQVPSDIILLDMNMPGRGGLDLIKELKVLYPRLLILIVSIHPEKRFAVRALKAGASGYVTKDCALEELVNAIRKITTKGRYISASLAEHLAFEIDINSDRLPHETLSDRELQVLCMLASSKRVKDIAHELSISVSTVSTYRSRILEKMNMKNDLDLALYARENNLVD